MTMIIQSDFISEVAQEFYAALAARGDLCKVAHSELSVQFYKKHMFQELYALRYLPAYYFEYCVLAHELKERVGSITHPLNIASFGCGLSPDYYALRDNLGIENFIYVGYDAVQWSSQKLMPQVGPNHSFRFQNVGNLTVGEISDVDVFVFPKSIGDIRNGGHEIIEALGNLIAATTKSRIFFLNSYVTKGFNKPLDLSAFKEIHKALLAANFATEDDVEQTFYRHDGVTTDRPIGLRKMSYDFIYPPNLAINCSKKQDTDPACSDCPVPRSPILTNAYMSFQLIEYRRNDN